MMGIRQLAILKDETNKIRSYALFILGQMFSEIGKKSVAGNSQLRIDGFNFTGSFFLIFYSSDNLVLVFAQLRNFALYFGYAFILQRVCSNGL